MDKVRRLFEYIDSKNLKISFELLLVSSIMLQIVDLYAMLFVIGNLIFFVLSYPISGVNQTLLDILLGLRISAFLISVGYFFITIDWIKLLDAIGK